MYGELFREWVLFLKERKLYSKFIIHYRAASASCRTWGREKLSFKLLNGGDYIMPNKNDSLSFSGLTSSMQVMDWYLPSNVTSNWVSLATEFGELNGYIEKRKNDNLYSLSFDEGAKYATSGVYRVERRTKHEKEAFGKWYDRFNGVNIRNRYRR